MINIDIHPKPLIWVGYRLPRKEARQFKATTDLALGQAFDLNGFGETRKRRQLASIGRVTGNPTAQHKDRGPPRGQFDRRHNVHPSDPMV